MKIQEKCNKTIKIGDVLKKNGGLPKRVKCEKYLSTSIWTAGKGLKESMGKYDKWKFCGWEKNYMLYMHKKRRQKRNCAFMSNKKGLEHEIVLVAVARGIIGFVVLLLLNDSRTSGWH